METTAILSVTLKEFSGIGTATACCALCTTVENCQAWTLKNNTCALKADLAKQQHDPEALSGYLPTVATHYSAAACLLDEVKWDSIPSISGGFCSPPCADDGFCPSDAPKGSKATAKCVLNDPVGSGKHCALACTEDTDCGTTGATCATKFGTGLCIYPEPGELRVFHTDECPPGWEESELTKGYLLVGRPSGGNSGTQINMALRNNEKSRVGPHLHEVEVTDPGHSHGTNIWNDRWDKPDPGPHNFAKWTSGAFHDPEIQTESSKTSVSVSVKPSIGEGYPLSYVLICQKVQS